MRAQEEAEPEPGKDHPSVPRFPGMRLDESRETDFDAFDFVTDADGTKHVEGRSWHLVYRLKEGARRPSPLEIVRNYENQFKAKGGRVLNQNVNPDEGYTTMMMPLGAGERWLRLEIYNQGAQCNMEIIETAEMKQKVEFSADQMAEELKSSGKVTLRGILFDTAKSAIKPESNALLDEVAAMLKADAGLKVKIEGHTDNVGAKAALVARGIAADRLTTEGYGDTKPVADNSSEEGRAQNRRVELVKP